MSLQRNRVGLTILFGGTPLDNCEVLRVQRSAGGRRLDFAEYEVKPGYLQPLQDVAVSNGMGVEVKISAVIDGSPRIIHWGYTSRQAWSINEGAEAVRVVSRTEPHHFGKPLYGARFVTTGGTRLDITGAPTVFNPVIDDKRTENRSKVPYDEPGSPHAFVNPESARTSKARANINHGEGTLDKPQFWLLCDAVHYLCWYLNSDQTYIKNPTLEELKTILGEDTELVRDVAIPANVHLPEALDRLLEPLGYSWFVSHPSLSERKLKFFKRSAGEQVTVKLQRPPDFLDRSLTELAENDIAFSIGELANQITVIGDYIEVEGTWELYRAWSSSDDSLGLGSAHQLAMSSDTFVDHPNVWRKWVLNEAGDYNDLRSEITAARSLNSEFGENQLPIRRRFLPTLSRRVDARDYAAPVGEHRGVTVEYHNGTEWKLIPNTHDFSVEILEKECGIYFRGENIPLEIAHKNTNAKVRVTASLRSDKRLSYTATKQTTSPSSLTVERVIDARERFQKRYRHSTSIYHGDSDYEADAVDHTTSIQSYAEKLRDAMDIATIEGEVTIDGLDNNFELGNVVTKIDGRNVSFASKAASAAEQRYPSIMGITYDVDDQATILTLESFRDEVV